ncbi:MAG: FAD-dependent oxidoreductase [Pseudomonadota bacterium]
MPKPQADQALFDYAIIGAGIAGASLAYQLAGQGSVLLLERESQPGYHSTGRSAAMFMESYGTPTIRALTRASRAFYETPPQGFADHPLMTPRGVLYIAREDQHELLAASFEELSKAAPNIEQISAATALAMVPVIKAEGLLGAIYEKDAQDIDVHALHQAYLRGMRAKGGVLQNNAELVAASHADDVWTLSFADGRTVQARHVVNAAGAWADVVAVHCGALPVGLEPRRRSAFTFAAPQGQPSHDWPAVVGIDESFYFKPDAGQLLGSPANADPVSPHDVVPEELDVAAGIYYIQEATTLNITRPSHTWAGLRSFVPDGDFVVGWDDACPNFFWLAAQGGYGIQTAAAVSELACALLLRQPVPARLQLQGVDAQALAPSRFR